MSFTWIVSPKSPIRRYLWCVTAIVCLTLAACDTVSTQGPRIDDTGEEALNAYMDQASKKGGGKGKGTDPTFVSLKVTVDTGTPRRIVDDDDLADIIEAGRQDDEFICAEGTECTAFDFFGCPDITKPCNAVEVTVKADDSFRVTFSGTPSVQGCTPDNLNLEGGCIFDEALEDRHRAWSWMLPLMPSVPLSGVVANADGEQTFTVYWQGQHVTFSDGSDKTWSLYPDLDYAGGMDYFIFRLGAANDKTQRVFSVDTYLDCDSDGIPNIPSTVGQATCFVQFQGASALPLLVRWDEITTQEVTITSGRGRNRTTVRKLQITPSILFNDGTQDLPASYFGFIERYMITYPDVSGSRRKSMVTSPVDIVATDRSDGGCYELRFLDVYPTNIGLLESAWDSSIDDPDNNNTARETVYIYDDDGGGFMHHIGGNCAGP